MNKETDFLLALARSVVGGDDEEKLLLQESLASRFDFEEAGKLLGQENIITPEENSKIFQQPKPQGLVVCPSMEQVQQCAAANKKGTRKWLLAYCSDFSLYEQKRMVNADPNQKHFGFHETVEFSKKEKSGLSIKKPAGFYLIDMEPRPWNGTIGDAITAEEEKQDTRNKFQNSKPYARKHEAYGDKAFVDYMYTGIQIFAQVVLTYQRKASKPLFLNLLVMDYSSRDHELGILVESDGLWVTSEAYPHLRSAARNCICRIPQYWTILEGGGNE